MTKKQLQRRIGENIRKARRERDISQQELASRCDFEKSNMARLEAGNTNPTAFTLYKISVALEIPVSRLLELD